MFAARVFRATMWVDHFLEGYFAVPPVAQDGHLTNGETRIYTYVHFSPAPLAATGGGETLFIDKRIETNARRIAETAQIAHTDEPPEIRNKLSKGGGRLAVRAKLARL